MTVRIAIWVFAVAAAVGLTAALGVHPGTGQSYVIFLVVGVVAGLIVRLVNRRRRS
jgi:hypothetical protein